MPTAAEHPRSGRPALTPVSPTTDPGPTPDHGLPARPFTPAFAPAPSAALGVSLPPTPGHTSTPDRSVALGTPAGPPRPASTPDPLAAVHPSGSPRSLRADEVAVLTLLAEGLPLDAVARRLAVSERTLRRRTRAICDLLGVPAAITAVAWAARRGLL
jgi:DNA-binding CsgD family transcriptional regulator